VGRWPIPHGWRIEHLGSETLIYCEIANGRIGVVARVEPELANGLRIGAGIGLMPDAAKVIYFGADGMRLRGGRPPLHRTQDNLVHHG
jgi:hypothetical protein